jgi:RHS repeat-associated protein
MIFDHPDEIGSATTATDCTGNTVNEKLYYPFGEFWTGYALPNLGMHQEFAQLPDYDPETDQYNTLARHYSPSGRWMSPDPGGLKFVHFDDPQTWNMYAYVRNNPTTLTDPTGEGFWDNLGSWLQGNGWNPPPPPPPPPPTPPSGEAKEAFRGSESGYHPNGGKETVANIAGHVNAETQGMKDSKSENVPLSTAREEIAHVRINSEEAYGNKVDRRAGMAPVKMSGPDFQRSVDAAINAAVQNAQGADPTNGAIRMNMRTSMGDTSNYQGFPIHTQAGPYISTTEYKVINTYGP